MCGIAGYFNIKGSESTGRSTLERMITPLAHRGPDGYGFYRGTDVGLAHARLSIIDLSGGWQPLSNEDDNLWIIFNGEIFNYPELRRELIGRGHSFSTDSDTEVIIHLYEEMGWQCLSALNGQFAIGLYDKKRNELFLARDRMGIRPLFYTQHEGIFYFASEIKSIFSADNTIPRKFNLDTIGDIFTFWTPVIGETVFHSIEQLPAGTWMKVGKKGVETPRNYWEFPLDVDEAAATAADYAEELRSLLIDAVRLRLRADVPVGAYLSGGLDSSAITSIIKNYTDNPLRTFSVSFADSVYDEQGEQQQMVDHLRTDHRQIRCSYENIAAVFPEIIYHTEVPILRTAPAPLYLLSKLVRENGYKVVLTGEGADEIFGGYDIFKEAKIRAFIQRMPHSSLRPLLLKRLYPYLALSPTKSAEYAQTFFNTDADPADPYYAHRPRWKTTAWAHTFFTEEVKSRMVEPEQRLAALFPSLGCGDFFLRAQLIETKMLLGNYLLSSQGDRMAMANSVEGRFPFLDHRLVELAGKIPPSLKMKVLNEKFILKQAVGDLLPKDIVRRRKQPYMAPDILSFFGGKVPEYLDHYLSAAKVEEAGVFKAGAVDRFIRKCRKGTRQGFRENMAFTGILSTQIIYDRFIKAFTSRTTGPLANVIIDRDDTVRNNHQTAP